MGEINVPENLPEYLRIIGEVRDEEYTSVSVYVPIEFKINSYRKREVFEWHRRCRQQKNLNAHEQIAKLIFTPIKIQLLTENNSKSYNKFHFDGWNSNK